MQSMRTNDDRSQTNRARLAGAGLLAVLMAATLAPGAEAQTLRGSKGSVEKMYWFAVNNHLAFRDDPEAIATDAGKGRLVPLGGSLDYQLTTQIGWPYVTPETKRWVEGFASQYAAVCQAPLIITSASRPLSRQPRNANPHSVHPAGIAVDLRRPPDGPCREWTRQALVELEQRGLIEATEERHPVHLHVAVLTTPGKRETVPLLRVAGQDPSAGRAAWLAARQRYVGGTTAASPASATIAAAPANAPSSATVRPMRAPYRLAGVVVTQVASEAAGEVALDPPSPRAGSTTEAKAASAVASTSRADGATAASDSSPRQARSGRTYRVRPGDTLWDIARRNHTRVDALLSQNHLRRNAALRPGDVIRLPEADN